MSGFKRNVYFEPGHDCIRFECCNGKADCVPGGGGSHGIGGVNIRWVVRGEKGAVQFALMTSDWLPDPGGWRARSRDRQLFGPMPSDLGYHSPAPRYEGQTSTGPCPHLDGAECYYDGSSLNAYEPWNVLCNEGGEALFEYLERYYASVFEGAEFPMAAPYKFAKRGTVTA